MIQVATDLIEHYQAYIKGLGTSGEYSDIDLKSVSNRLDF